TSRPSTSRQTRTNKPTFHSNRFWLISKIRFLWIGDAVHKTIHLRVLRLKDFVGSAGEMDAAAVQHEDALADPPRAAHVMRHRHRRHRHPFANPHDELIDAVRNDRVQT